MGYEFLALFLGAVRVLLLLAMQDGRTQSSLPIAHSPQQFDSVLGYHVAYAARPACRQARFRAARLDQARSGADNCAATVAPGPAGIRCALFAACRRRRQ